MKRIKLILPVIIALALSGCVKDNYDEPNDERTSKREWYELVKTDTLTNRQINQDVQGNPMPIGNTIVRNSFLYHSSNGSDTVTLSGAVCWPLEKSDSYSEIWLENHYLTVRWDECPTQLAQGGMIVASMRKAIYIGPDYQGLGLSRDLNQPYLNTILLADQSIDCYKAAMTLLKDYGIDLADDYCTYNLGYSLGGAVSVAVARQIESDPELMEFTHLKKTLCGGGPYDQVAYFNHFLETPDRELTYPIAFLCAVKSIVSSSQSFEYDYEDCFSKKLLDSGIIEALDSKNYDADEINKMLSDDNCTSIADILSADAIDMNSQLSKAIFKAIGKLDLTADWTPRIPILVRHSKADAYVPFICMESVMANWADNPNVTFEVIETGTHIDDGNKFYINVLFNRYPLD